ncbi:MAG TPA: HEAT repeat domain-containing protein [Gemmataceae bacterium]|nr:HEAT repeat domain-containing protein [Gemmataceae bacterium]
MRGKQAAVRLRWWVIVGSVLVLAGAAIAAEIDPVARDEQTLRDAKLATDGPALLEFFRKRTASDADPAKVKTLIRQLGDDSFEVRERASSQLVALGAPAVPYLREALKNTDIEVVRRAEECLRRIGEGSSGALVDAAARLLAVRRPAGAAEVLLAYLPSAEDEIAAEEVRGALAALALRDGKAEPALVNALTDKLPVRRAAAAVALLKTGLAELRPAVEKLLEDPDHTVRLAVALALADARDKKAFPVLIELLDELPAEKTWLIQDLLYRLAGDQAPTTAPGSDAVSRRKYRDAWADWWAKQGEKSDLARLDPPQLHGYTMVILLDQGRLMELDAKNRPRWQIEGLQFPLDAQLLPGERVLIAEQAGNKVTERNLKGEVLWQKQVPDPLVAQRLPNGNTFIATRTQLLELDRNGKEVFSHIPPAGELIMRAQRLPDGDLALVVSGGNGGASRFVRLDPTGNSERYSFPVEVHTFGGRIEVLPNRRVLVPQMRNNRVVEHDPRGQIVWEITVDQPIVAVRLANGNTLVTCMAQQRAVELDRNGREVWEYKTTTRVTRAWRR